MGSFLCPKLQPDLTSINRVLNATSSWQLHANIGEFPFPSYSITIVRRYFKYEEKKACFKFTDFWCLSAQLTGDNASYSAKVAASKASVSGASAYGAAVSLSTNPFLQLSFRELMFYNLHIYSMVYQTCSKANVFLRLAVLETRLLNLPTLLLPRPQKLSMQRLEPGQRPNSE